MLLDKGSHAIVLPLVELDEIVLIADTARVSCHVAQPEASEQASIAPVDQAGEPVGCVAHDIHERHGRIALVELVQAINGRIEATLAAAMRVHQETCIRVHIVLSTMIQGWPTSPDVVLYTSTGCGWLLVRASFDVLVRGEDSAALKELPETRRTRLG